MCGEKKRKIALGVEPNCIVYGVNEPTNSLGVMWSLDVLEGSNLDILIKSSQY